MSLKSVCPWQRNDNKTLQCWQYTHEIQSTYLILNTVLITSKINYPIYLYYREIKRFCVDPFANYVVQRLIAKVNIEQVKIMHEKLEPLFDRLNRVVCGRKIIELMNERIAKSKLLNNPLGTSKLINDPFGKLQLMNGFIGKSP